MRQLINRVTADKLTEIERLENEFLEVANKVAKMNAAEPEQQKTTTEKGSGVKYNLSDIPTVELSNDNDLSKHIEKSSDNRHNVIKNYIFNLLGNKEVLLSDGRTAIFDKSDAKHIAFRAEPKNIAEVSKIEEIINKAVLMAEESSVVHPKFTYFAYYGVKVNYDGESFLLFLNVGEAKNDKKLHIYDITDRSKKRDVANQNNGFARPVGNALTNNISKHSIPNSTESVNKNSASKNDIKQRQFEIITEPKERNTPNRINGFGRPVGNALGKGVSNYSIPDTTNTANFINSAINDNRVIDRNKIKAEELQNILGLSLSLPDNILSIGSTDSIPSSPESVNKKFSLPENPTPEQIGQVLYDHEISIKA